MNTQINKVLLLSTKCSETNPVSNLFAIKRPIQRCRLKNKRTTEPLIHQEPNSTEMLSHHHLPAEGSSTGHWPAVHSWVSERKAVLSRTTMRLLTWKGQNCRGWRDLPGNPASSVDRGPPWGHRAQSSSVFGARTQLQPWWCPNAFCPSVSLPH